MCAFRIDPLIRIAPASGGLPCFLQYRSIHVVYLRRVIWRVYTIFATVPCDV